MHIRLPSSILACLVTVAGMTASWNVCRAAPIPLTVNDPNSFVLLSDLLFGGQFADGVIVGDKLFSEFFYSTLPNDDMPDASQVKVLGFQDLNDNWGISFHGTFLDLFGGGPSDALLRFTVEITPEALAQGWRISDAHLFMGGIGIGDNSFFAVDESFQGLNDTLNVYATTLGGPLNQDLADEVFFNQLYTKLRVTKDILAISRDPEFPARVTIIDQSFSQTLIPEPSSSIVMLSMIGINLALGRYRPSRNSS